MIARIEHKRLDKRLENITAKYKALVGEAEFDYSIQDALRFLRVLATSNFPMNTIFAEMENSQSQGYAVPATRLGLVKAPKRGGCYMADVRAVSFPISLADAREMYGPLARQ